MRVACSYCDRDAELVTGSAIYPHRDDLGAMKFWRCLPCGAYVGCHKAGARVPAGQGGSACDQVSDGTLPMGRLANAELRKWKSRAHQVFDPIWKARQMSRRTAYLWLARELGISTANCHIGMFDVDACRAVVAAVERRNQKA